MRAGGGGVYGTARLVRRAGMPRSTGRAITAAASSSRLRARSTTGIGAVVAIPAEALPLPAAGTSSETLCGPD
ncbi:hypothetical protein [Fodinicola feengrottensis]|uniref:hypothetical protein n=1 Tax=Fodinicola feengrottensis TaxID=435914 RepID=UPI0013D7BA22|nr:hypothetical protein [Fodinicola feengrottensis]